MVLKKDLLFFFFFLQANLLSSTNAETKTLGRGAEGGVYNTENFSAKTVNINIFLFLPFSDVTAMHWWTLLKKSNTP